MKNVAEEYKLDRGKDSANDSSSTNDQFNDRV